MTPSVATLPVRPLPVPDAAAVLGKAALRAADQLGIGQGELGAILGISPAAISRAAHGGSLPATGKATELATLFIRVFRALDAIVGGDAALAAAWLRNPNSALGGTPASLMKTLPGLIDCLAYLDARRAVV